MQQKKFSNKVHAKPTIVTENQHVLYSICRQELNNGQVMDDSTQDVQDGNNAVTESFGQESPNLIYDEVRYPAARGVLLTPNPSYFGFAKIRLEPNPSYQDLEITKTDQS